MNQYKYINQMGINSISELEAHLLEIKHVTFIGFSEQDVIVGKKNNLTVQLKENAKALDEVVVIGYGVQKKRDIVGAIEQVSGKVLENRSNPNIVRSML